MTPLMMKERLETYRRKKRRQEMMESIKSVIKIFSWNREIKIEKSEESMKEEQVRLHFAVDIHEGKKSRTLRKVLKDVLRKEHKFLPLFLG